ncbi:hypothetical protein DLREEDagrD3_08860 [Denitratisoma sp. agr-D3]
MFDFVKRALGQGNVPISDNPFGDKDATNPLPAPTGRASSLQLQRDEIIDSRGRIAGYRLRPLKEPGTIDSADYGALLANEGVAALARRRLALIPLTPLDWSQGNFTALAQSGTVFLLVAPAVPLSEEEWRQTANTILAAGASFALGNHSLPPPAKSLLPQARLFLMDFQALGLSRLETLVKKLRAQWPDLKLAADRVATWPERRLCLSLGIDYCLGGFASTLDEDDRQEEISESRLTLIEMLNLLRQEAELSELVTIAKRDPGVSLQVVAMANAPIVGLNQPVASLEQAIMVLGRESLYRWLAVSLFRAAPQRDQDEILLELALGRARFLELVAGDMLPKEQTEELFLVGLLSVMDALLGMPMSRVLEKLHLPATVQDVLLRSEGPYGRYLMLALAQEKDKAQQTEKLAEALGLDPSRLASHSLSAMAWAEAAMTQHRG